MLSKRNAFLSIDIGVHNLGFTLLIEKSHEQTNNLETLTFAENYELAFNIFDITEFAKKHYPKQQIVEQRCLSIKFFFEDLSKSFNLQLVLIERQVPSNTIAMELMYAIFSNALNYCSPVSSKESGLCQNVINFDPKNKFLLIHETYDTKNKHHKKQSISYAKAFLKNNYPELLTKFNTFEKQDDIADSLNQLLVYLASNSSLITFKNKELYNISTLRNYYDLQSFDA